MAKEKAIKIKPCPFCGGEAELTKYGVYSGLSPDLYCTRCPARMRTRDEDDESIKKLIKAWNRRAK